MAGSVNKSGSVRPTVSATNQLKPFNEGTRSLQIEINKAIDSGLIPGPRLKEDGIEGPKTRAKLQEYMDIKPETPATQSDRRDAKDPTVGEYIEGQIHAFGQELKEDAKLSAIMLAPGLNVVAGVIMTRHMNQAREQIAKLPMDPDGNWKKEAARILDAERHEAREEILALPGKAAQGVVDGVNAAVDGVHTAVDAVDRTLDQAADAVDRGVDQAVDAVDRTLTQAGAAVDRTIDQGIEAAQGVWNDATGKVGEAWAYAKVAVPRAFKEIATDAQVAAIMVNPLFVAPSAIILKNHMAKAYDRIMKLPMDPQGKWKLEAAKIRDEEQAAAKKEILGLPGRALHTVVDTATGIYEGAKKGVLIAGAMIEHEIKEEIEETKREVKAVRKGIGGFFGAIASGLSRFAKWIAGE